MVSDESHIRELHERTAIPGASIKQLKAPREDGKGYWWRWRTEWVDVDPYEVESAILELLNQYRPYFAAIKEFRGSDAACYLQLVSEWQENEQPWGFSLSRKAISLLHELGAEFDHDANWDVT